MRKEIYEKVTKKLIEIIETSGKLPWKRPWNSANITPFNYASKKIYHGFNYVLLSAIAQEKEYSCNGWITFNQIKSKGLQLKKGSEGIPVVFWNFTKRTETVVDTDDSGNNVTKKVTKSIPFMKYYTVFNICDTNADIEEIKKTEKEFINNKDAEKIINEYKERENIKIDITLSDKAFYSPTLDSITVPAKEQYENDGEFYSTLFHEMVHSTGHVNRLDRWTSTEDRSFGSESYTKEELIAEIGASILCGIAEIDNTIENSAGYIKGWLSKIKEDPSILVTASNRGQKAVDYILGHK